MKRIAVAGAGGFIGGWLVQELLKSGCNEIVAGDIKPLEEWHQFSHRATNMQLDLSDIQSCRRFLEGVDEVYNLAADMGGMGFIELNKAACMLSVLINTHMLQAAKERGVAKFFFASSACVYRADLQESSRVTALREQDAYPASPEDGYGWEKLFSERMCRHFTEDFGVQTRVARFHNVYGPLGTYEGGREKAPAAICRKVAQALISGIHEIEIWGDGEQTRSFTYISDAIFGVKQLMSSTFCEPVNIGSSELVSINQLVSMVESIAGVKLVRKYNLSAPLGVRGRNSDNSLVKKVLNWEPSMSLFNGLSETYTWVLKELTDGRQLLKG